MISHGGADCTGPKVAPDHGLEEAAMWRLKTSISGPEMWNLPGCPKNLQPIYHNFEIISPSIDLRF